MRLLLTICFFCIASLSHASSISQLFEPFKLPATTKQLLKLVGKQDIQYSDGERTYYAILNMSQLTPLFKKTQTKIPFALRVDWHGRDKILSYQFFYEKTPKNYDYFQRVFKMHRIKIKLYECFRQKHIRLDFSTQNFSNVDMYQLTLTDEAEERRFYRNTVKLDVQVDFPDCAGSRGGSYKP